MSIVPYQVDHSVKNTSKTFGFSKKRVTFKFGIANPEALQQGLTGAHCRGSEHEVIFIWSLNSGKRQVLADGKDVHFSETGQNGWTTDQVFQHHFQLVVPNFSSPLRCHLITQPANRDMPNVHPFDLRVNGLSYFSFSKIFQLGTPQMIARPLKGKGGGHRPYQMGYPEADDDPYITPEERKAIAAAKLASIRDMRDRGASGSVQGSAAPPMNRDEGNLINLMDAPAPPPTMPQPQPISQFVSSMTMDGSLIGGGLPPASAPAPFAQQPYSNYSVSSMPTATGTQQSSAYGQTAQTAPAYSYGQQPPQQQNAAPAYGQPPPPQQNAAPAYGQQPSQQPQGGYGLPPTAPNSWATAYQQPPTPQGYYGASSQNNYGFSSPQPNSMMSPTGQSIASYGSAPSFAQPPQQQPPAQSQYPRYSQY